jgi:hypothetical protein
LERQVVFHSGKKGRHSHCHFKGFRFPKLEVLLLYYNPLNLIDITLTGFGVEGN